MFTVDLFVENKRSLLNKEDYANDLDKNTSDVNTKA